MAGDSSYWQRYWSKRVTRRVVLRGGAVAAAGLTAAAVVGCGDDDEAPAATTPAATATPQATNGQVAGRPYFRTYPAAPSYSSSANQALLREFHFSVIGPQVHVLGTPQLGGVFSPQTFNPPPTLHPLDPAVASTGQWPGGPYAANLVMADWWDDPEQNGPTTRYAVSESFETPDPTTFNFRLRTPRPWFHDVPPANGDPLTIEDIQATYELYAGHRFFEANFKDITSITEPEPGLVQIKTSQPAVHLLGALRKEAFTILNRKLIEEGDEAMNSKAISLGAFTQHTFIPSQLRAYKRNPNWWWPKDQFGNQQPYQDGFTMNIIADPAAGLAAFRTGQTDYYRPNSVEEFDQLRGDLGDDVWPFASVGPASSTVALVPSMRDPALQNPNVRRAISMGIDQQTILDVVFGGAATPRPWIPWYFRGLKWPETLDQMGPYFKFDPEGAKNLLAEANVQTPLKLQMFFTGTVEQAGGGGVFATGDPYVEPARQTLKDIGIELDLVPQDRTSLRLKTFDGEWIGMGSISIGTSAVDADEWVQRAVSGTGSNPNGISDPKIDQWFLDERAEVDPVERAKIFQKIEQYAVQDQLLWGPVMPRIFSLALWKRYVHNMIETSLYTINGGLQFQQTEVWLDSNAPSRDIDNL